MKKRLLRWWYRITGQADKADFMLDIALLMTFDDDYAMQLWERDYRHIHDIMKDKK